MTPKNLNDIDPKTWTYIFTCVLFVFAIFGGPRGGIIGAAIVGLWTIGRGWYDQIYPGIKKS